MSEKVDLPAGVEHCGPTAYNRYGCRCRPCLTWRRLYDQTRYWKQYSKVVKKRDGARDYLAHRGVQIFGPGPFRKNPIRLAELVADYFNDDLSLWTEREDTAS